MLADTNILIYAINIDSPKSKTAQTFLQKNAGKLHIAHQNVLETIRVLTHRTFSRPMKMEDALRATLTIVNSCHILSPNKSSYYLTLELIAQYKLSGNRIFDAYLVATALSNGITTIATDNTRDLSKFSQIRIFNPFSA